MARKRKFKTTNRKQSGGYLIGPSHEEGGILARTPGMPDIELEGGEYVINARTTEVLGTEFLDKLNRTASPYHTEPGFNRGQLPGSNYRDGGKIKKLTHGGRHNGYQQKVSKNLPPSYRKSNIIRSFCKNCLFFKANYCNNWKAKVDRKYICDSWDASLATIIKQRGKF